MKSGRNDRNFRIPATVKDFYTCRKKDVAKDFMYSSKKEIKEEYYRRLICNDLPDVIHTLVFEGHREEVKKIVPFVYARIVSDHSAHEDKDDQIAYDNKKFIEYFNEFLDDDDEEIENIELFPIIVGDICREAAEYVNSADEECVCDLSDVVDLSTRIMKKKLKKMTKDGISKEVAFDCLSIIPTTKVLKQRGRYRMSLYMRCLYAHAKDDPKMDFEKITKNVISSDYYPSLIAYLLLEKKSDYVSYTDEQKDFFNGVTEWAINTLESFKKNEIKEVLDAYFQWRKRDKENNRDSNRRYFLSSIPEKEFPNITTVISKMKDSNPWIEEFL